METLYGEKIEREFPAGREFEVSIHGMSGDIRVRRGPDDLVRLKATVDGPDDAGISVEQSDNRLSFRPSTERPPSDIDFKVEVPAGCSVEAESVHADIEVRDTDGPLHLHSVHGDINVTRAGGSARVVVESVDGDVSLSEIRGEIALSSVNGDIAVSQAEGVLNVQTTNGSLTVAGSRLQRFHINTQNGDLFIDTPLLPGEHSFARSSNGDVELAVPSDSGFTVQMRTQNGDLDCELSHEVINGSKRNRQLRVNGGGATVEMETANGDVRVRASDGKRGRAEQGRHHADWMPQPPRPVAPHMPAPPAMPPSAAVPATPAMPAVPAVPPTPTLPSPDAIRDLSPEELRELEEEDAREQPVDTLDVLARLEKGDLTVDEAMEQLTTRSGR